MPASRTDLLFDRKPGIIDGVTGLVPVFATLAQSAEQTLRKRQVKGSSPLGGLVDVEGPQLGGCWGLCCMIYCRSLTPGLGNG